MARILIVDDEPDELHLFARMLATDDHRYQILQVTNGQRALSMLRSRQPDIVLLDLMMPGMNGFDATRAIKAGNPNTRVVVLSSHVGEVYKKAALEHSADGYIEKSSMKSALQAVLEGYSENEMRVAV